MTAKILSSAILVAFILTHIAVVSAHAQVTNGDSTVLTLNIDGEVIKGKETLPNLPHDDRIRISYGRKFFRSRYGQVFVKYSDSTKHEFDFPFLQKLDLKTFDLQGFWQWQGIKNDAYANILQYGFEYSTRKEVEEDALTALNNFEKEHLMFNDRYLEDYLYTVLRKIFPTTLSDGRPGFINIKVLSQSTPNAWVYPNGTMVINTGLLSTIGSEAELIAVMSHEVAHFALDHHIVNRRKQMERQESEQH